jgi:glycosyltransferase involved in cell wall biosynthesis
MSYPIQITALMSIYNEPIEWIKFSIDSILNQSYSDFEFIILNDKPDRLENRDLLNEYAILDSRIKIIHNDHNIGLTKSLNKGLVLAKGKYIARMDADDISIVDRFTKQYFFLENNDDYIACGSSVIIIKEEEVSKIILNKPDSNIKIQASLFFESPIVHPTLFFRNFKNVFYNPLYVFSQDYDLITKLAKSGKLFNFKKPLLFYRVSIKQITKQKLKEQNYYAKIIRFGNIVGYINRQTKLVTEDQSKENIDLCLKIIKKELLSFNYINRTEISYIYYSLMMYFIQKSVCRSLLIISYQFFLRIKLKYRLRLIISIFYKFNDQKF